MKTLISWICLLVYLAFGLSAIAILAGWIRIRGLESLPDAQQKIFRKGLWMIAIIFTFAGIGSILQEVGALDSLRRWAYTLE